MNPWIKQTVRIERTTTEFADVEFVVDGADYEQWLGALSPTSRLLVEYIKADSEYPMNLPLEGAAWVEHDVEHDVVVNDSPPHLRW